jgi:hypothetical protein
MYRSHKLELIWLFYWMINLLPNLSTNHNLCSKSSIWECDFTLVIYFSKPFIWSKEGPRGWSPKPWIKGFKYLEIQKVGIHRLRVLGLVPLYTFPHLWECLWILGRLVMLASSGFYVLSAWNCNRATCSKVANPWLREVTNTKVHETTFPKSYILV